MGMTRVVLTSGVSMLFDAPYIGVIDGHLSLKASPTQIIATFAPGVWAYHYFVVLGSSDPPARHERRPEADD